MIRDHFREFWRRYQAESVVRRVLDDAAKKRREELDPHWVNAVCRTRIFGHHHVEEMWDRLGVSLAKDRLKMPVGEKRKHVVAALDLAPKFGWSAGYAMAHVYHAWADTKRNPSQNAD